MHIAWKQKYTRGPMLFLCMATFLTGLNSWSYPPIQSCTFNNIPQALRKPNSDQTFTVNGSEMSGAKAQQAIQKLKQNPKTSVSPHRDQFGHLAYIEYILESASYIDHRQCGQSGPCEVNFEGLEKQFYCSQYSGDSAQCALHCRYHWEYELPGS